MAYLYDPEQAKLRTLCRLDPGGDGECAKNGQRFLHAHLRHRQTTPGENVAARHRPPAQDRRRG